MMDDSQRPIAVRPATVADADTIAAFQMQMAWETERVRLDPDTVHCGVTTVFAVASRGAYRIAERAGAGVGCMLLTPEWSDWRNRTMLWIQSVYVIPEFRRQGVFRAFYRHAQQMVRDDPSLGGLRLYVEKSNLGAQETYAALGMNGEHYRMFEWMKPA